MWYPTAPWPRLLPFLRWRVCCCCCWFIVVLEHQFWCLFVFGPCFLIWFVVSYRVLPSACYGRELVALLLLRCGFQCSVSSSRCNVFVWGLWLWHYLVILTIVISNIFFFKSFRISRVDFYMFGLIDKCAYFNKQIHCGNNQLYVMVCVYIQNFLHLYRRTHHTITSLLH